MKNIRDIFINNNLFSKYKSYKVQKYENTKTLYENVVFGDVPFHIKTPAHTQNLC